MALLAAIVVGRLWIQGHFGLGVDEAHYALYGMLPDWSYFDHPPLVGWVEALSIRLLGPTNLGIRLPAILIGFVASWLCYGWLLLLWNDRRMAFVGVAALSASPLFGALFLMLLPDTLLCLWIVPILWYVLRVEARGRWSDWAGLGILLGLAGLSKYTSILFPVAIGVYLVVRGRWDRILTPKALVGVLLAAALASPVAIWNYQHDWASFAYQGDHVSGSRTLHLNKFLQSLAAQVGAYSPLLYPVAIFGWIQALRQRSQPAMLLTAIYGAVIFLFFAAGSFMARALPHWTSPFFLLFVPIGAGELFRRSLAWKRYTVVAISLSGLLTAAVHAELRYRFVPFPDYRSLQRDIYGFQEAVARAAQLIRDPEHEALAVAQWTLASRAMFYGRLLGIPVYLVDQRKDQFDLWQSEPAPGTDLLFLSNHDEPFDVAARIECDAVELAEEWDVKVGSHIVDTYRLVWCRNFRGLKP
ncbi:MAG: glycosyltransferase family 39 protein [Planctomycetes bacterium]|nr:glycosyltransferase family 39 protein [Planctomycetota bacterium]MCB9909768.1 glycosyltransferase family 39 protein [Planctomycetota bacterium]MCB9912323.1 glycosyltransferase family 39 protein [Planctomycetota bacterium]HPF13815.1 glycosyltransferase family 39 protein [Planctomycetota bacterium]HRV80241.1 glycosyltransferase family 39 protein [Planctomycetota bacterium]